MYHVETSKPTSCYTSDWWQFKNVDTYTLFVCFAYY